MKNRNDIYAVLFDLDDTLIDRNRMFRNWATDFMIAHSVSDETSIKDAIEDLVRFERRGATPRDEVFSHFVIKLEQAGQKILTKEIAQSYEKDYRRYTVVFDDTMDTLCALKNGGYRLGIITNGRTVLQSEKIKRAKLEPQMDIILVSEAVGYAKPDPRIFQLAAERLNYKPQNCLYVGDRFEWDIEGPLSAEMQACFYRRNIFEDERRDFICAIDRLSELKALLL